MNNKHFKCIYSKIRLINVRVNTIILFNFVLFTFYTVWNIEIYVRKKMPYIIKIYGGRVEYYVLQWKAIIKYFTLTVIIGETELSITYNTYSDLNDERSIPTS